MENGGIYLEVNKLYDVIFIGKISIIGVERNIFMENEEAVYIMFDTSCTDYICAEKKTEIENKITDLKNQINNLEKEL